MMNKAMWLTGLMIAVGVAIIGCKGEQASNQAAAVANSGAILSAELSARVERVLGDYEALRAVLAGDRLDEVAAIATRFETDGRAASVDAPVGVRAHLDAAVLAAGRLKGAGSADDQRRIFGDISRAVVSLLSEQSALAKGRYVFQCPMAQGYQKWVQTTDGIENPYMGGRMLRCGSATEWGL